MVQIECLSVADKMAAGERISTDILMLLKQANMDLKELSAGDRQCRPVCMRSQ